MATNISKGKFGTLPVFLTAISTILGAILFLRFGWAIGQVGFAGVIGVIIIGHLVTIPTALAVAEIATNQKVLGGGAYYIISRSFGFNIGGAIGIALFASQAISVAFYIIAFSEAFDPVIHYVAITYGIVISKRIIALISFALLSLLILRKGANIGMKALYVVAALLIIAIISFLAGHPIAEMDGFVVNDTVENPERFFYVFIVIFPAFTGLAAGLGLSGDLKDPRKSIPRGTLWATIIGMVVYIIIAYKFAISATPKQLSSDQLIMEHIAIWGPIIPIGLAAASLSSALGSIIVAPRTLQAIGIDNILPGDKFNKWLSKVKRSDNEPINGDIITIVIAFFFVAIGDINFVAEIISMFFMLTYGAICLISVLEHFAADPSYRPTFRSRWYISLIGAILSIWLMISMNLVYAILALTSMVLFYIVITSYNPDKKGLAKLFRGVLFQISRQLQIIGQRTNKEDPNYNWRPFVVSISADTFKRRSAFDLLRWLSHKYGSGTYIHYIRGFLNEKNNEKSQIVLKKLLNLASGVKNKVYLDTIISPSLTSAIAQVIQLKTISGKVNNLLLFEFSRTEPESLNDAMDNYNIIRNTGFDICVLNTSYKGFGYKREMHIWLRESDYANANLMILLGYILLGHPEWRKGLIKIFALYPSNEHDKRWNELTKLVKSGRIPISLKNIELLEDQGTGMSYKNIICERSLDADLTIIGFSSDKNQQNEYFVDLFTGYNDMGNILFVNSNSHKTIS